jgi:hypothetical protein
LASTIFIDDRRLGLGFRFFHHHRITDDRATRRTSDKIQPVFQITIPPRSKFDDEDVPLLKSFKNLKTLILMGNRITDAGLRERKGLDDLNMLDLRSKKVTPEGFKELQGLKSLTILFFVDSQITDEDLKNVGMLKISRA